MELIKFKLFLGTEQEEEVLLELMEQIKEKLAEQEEEELVELVEQMEELVKRT